MNSSKKITKTDLVIAFDLGGTKLCSGVVNGRGKILDQMTEPVEFGKGKSGFLQQLSMRAYHWRCQYPKVKVLGISSCGPLDCQTGSLLQPTNFPRWGTIQLGRVLKDNVGLPVNVFNDAAAAAMAEGWLGAAQKSRHWITLTLGTGLGTGIVMNRQAFLGGSGLGPEAGHMIITSEQYVCGCGNVGCAEACLSGTALLNRMREHKLPGNSARDLFKLADEGNAKAVQLIGDYRMHLAKLVHNLSVMYKPEVITLGGGVSQQSRFFLSATHRIVKEMLRGRKGFYPRMKVSPLKADLGLLGGAWVGIYGGKV